MKKIWVFMGLWRVGAGGVRGGDQGRVTYSGVEWGNKVRGEKVP